MCDIRECLLLIQFFNTAIPIVKSVKFMVQVPASLDFVEYTSIGENIYLYAYFRSRGSITKLFIIGSRFFFIDTIPRKIDYLKMFVLSKDHIMTSNISLNYPFTIDELQSRCSLPRLVKLPRKREAVYTTTFIYGSQRTPAFENYRAVLRST